MYQFIGFVTSQEPPIFQWLFSYYETEPGVAVDHEILIENLMLRLFGD